MAVSAAVDAVAVAAAVTSIVPFCSGAVALERLLLHIWGVLLQQQQQQHQLLTFRRRGTPGMLLLQQQQRQHQQQQHRLAPALCIPLPNVQQQRPRHQPAAAVAVAAAAAAATGVRANCGISLVHPAVAPARAAAVGEERAPMTALPNLHTVNTAPNLFSAAAAESAATNDTAAALHSAAASQKTQSGSSAEQHSDLGRLPYRSVCTAPSIDYML